MIVSPHRLAGGSLLLLALFAILSCASALSMIVATGPFEALRLLGPWSAIFSYFLPLIVMVVLAALTVLGLR